MKSIWVVEQGTYSDYKVVGVFTTKENADLIASRISTDYDEATVAEWPVDPAVDEINQGMTQYHVRMLRDGTVEVVQSHNDLMGYELANTSYIWQRSKAMAYRGQDVQDCLNNVVWATDSKHAIKITNERRLQMIATGQWEQ